MGLGQNSPTVQVIYIWYRINCYSHSYMFTYMKEDDRTLREPYLLQNITCYYGSLSAPSNKLKCSLLVESARCQDELREEMCCVCLGNFVSVSAKISITHLCQTNAARANYTAFWDDTGRP